MSKSHHASPQNVRTTTTSVGGTETAVPRKVNNQAAALAALYQGEKTDASYVFNTAMAMMGIAVAYLVGAMQFIDKISHGPIAWLFLLLLPIPVWLIVAFHSLMTLNAMSHGISVRIIERALFEMSELPVIKENLVGSASGDKIMDINRSKPIHRLITAVVYGGVAFMVIGFTAYSLYSANEIIKNDVALAHAGTTWIAISVYSLFVIMVAFSWKVGFRIIREASVLADLPVLAREK